MKKSHQTNCKSLVYKVARYAVEECDFQSVCFDGYKLFLLAKADSAEQAVCHAARCIADKFANSVDLSELLVKRHPEGYTHFVVSLETKNL
jgi:hypothetical protein